MKKIKLEVSVPYRGLILFNRVKTDNRRNEESFRPLSGTYFI